MSVRQSNTQAFLYRERPFLTLCCEIVSGSAFFCLNGCDNCCLGSRVCCCGSCRSFYFASLVCVPALVIINPKAYLQLLQLGRNFGCVCKQQLGLCRWRRESETKTCFCTEMLICVFSPLLVLAGKVVYFVFVELYKCVAIYNMCVQLCVCVCASELSIKYFLSTRQVACAATTISCVFKKKNTDKLSLESASRLYLADAACF